MADSDDDDYYSDTTESSEEEIDVHEIARTGSVDEMNWALMKDRMRLLTLKDKKTEECALHCAAKLGRVDMCINLLKKGAIIDYKDGKQRTALMAACGEGFTDLARLFLERKADIRLKDNNCQTALHYAVESAHVETCVMLIKRGVDLSAEEAKQGRTALHFAAEFGLSELSDILIVRGSDMYASGDSIYSKTPLHLAVMNGHAETAEILVKRGADLEAMSGFLDKTPLHLAAEKGHSNCVQVLVEAGADMGAMGYNTNGASPLHLAAIHGHAHVVEYLISKGASITLQGKRTCEGVALHVAAQAGHTHVVELLLELGSDIEQKDSHNGYTPLHTCCKYSQFEPALALINHGANLTALANNGRYPLELISNADSYMRENLRLAGLEYEQEIERRAYEADREKREAEAEAKRLKEEAEELARKMEVEREARERKQSRFCALMLACCDVSGELSALTDIAIEYPDCDINCSLEKQLGSFPLTRAAYNGFNVIVAALLKWKDIDVNVAEKDGNTALHFAASRGKSLQHKVIAEMLLVAGARTGMTNNQGQVPASIAATTYLAEIIRKPDMIYSSTDNHDLFDDISMATYGTPFSKDKIEAMQNGASYPYNNNNNGYGSMDNMSLSSIDSLPAASIGVDMHGLTPGPRLAPHMRHQVYHGSPNKVQKNFDLDSQVLPKNVEASLLDKNKYDPEHLIRNKFGPPPAHYNGCKDDMFFEAFNKRVPVPFQYQLKKDRENLATDSLSIPSVPMMNDGGEKEEKEGIDYDKLPLQAGYVPTAFDSTDEWVEVKDYLWMLGYPYEKNTIPENKNQKKGRGGVAEVEDARAKLYKISGIMDDMQRVFSDPQTSGYPIIYEKGQVPDKNKSNAGDVQLKFMCKKFVQLSLEMFVPPGLAIEPGALRAAKKSVLEARLVAVHDSEMVSEEIKNLLAILIEYGTRQVVETSNEEADNNADTDVVASSVTYTPRERRMMVDSVYDVSFTFKWRAIQDYTTDNIRVAYWLKTSNKGKFSKDLQYDMSLEVMLFLQDQHLHYYINDFQRLGFKLLADYCELTLKDCQDYFPFLKLGDAIRLARGIEMLNPELVDGYHLRASNREVASVSLPPIPKL